jgi:hypothetical protein
MHRELPGFLRAIASVPAVVDAGHEIPLAASYV